MHQTISFPLNLLLSFLIKNGAKLILNLVGFTIESTLAKHNLKYL